MSKGERNRRRRREEERCRREHEEWQERRARDAVSKMPLPRFGADPAIFAAETQAWMRRAEGEAGGDRVLLGRIEELAGQAMEQHLAEHFCGSVVVSDEAGRLMTEAGVSSKTVVDAHLQKHWASPNERSVVILSARVADSVVVRWMPEEARTYVWRLGEAEDDPTPETVAWRRRSGG